MSQPTGWKEKDDRTITEIRDSLKQQNLDVFIPWKPAHIAYLTNYYDILHINLLWEEMTAILVIPRAADAFIVGAHAHWAGAPEFGVAPWWLAERHSTDRPGEKALQRTVDLLKEKGWDKGRIGIETKWMPIAVYDYLHSALPDVEFVSADLLVPQIRFIKTKREHSLLKKAAEIGLLSMEAYMHAIRSGAGRGDPGSASRRRAEAALCRAAKAEGFAEARARKIRAQRALDYGGEWAGGPDRIAWTGGTDETLDWWDEEARKRFQSSTSRNWKNLPDDSPFLVTHFETRYQYYFSDLAWHEFYASEPAENELLAWGEKQVSFADAQHDFDMLRRVQSEALNQIRPGMSHLEAKKAVDAFLAADPEAKEHITNYYIHGIGLEIHEEPVLTGFVSEPTPRDGLIYFQPGAVVSSEWFTRLWTAEEPFVMTESGWQPLVDLKGLVAV